MTEERGEQSHCDDCETAAPSPDATDGADGSSGDAGGETVRLSVPEMDCPNCAGKVENALATLPGVTDVDPRPTSGRLVVTFDPSVTDRESIRDAVESAGYAVAGDETVTLAVPEMDCPNCAGKVENALAALAGVHTFDTRPTAGRVVVTYDADVCSRQAVVAAVENAGYEVVDDEQASGADSVWRSPRAVKTWAGAVLLVAGVTAEFLAGVDPTLLTLAGRDVSVSWLAYVAAAAIAGAAIVRNGYYSARNRNLDIDLLMSVGLLGALAVDLPFEAATLAVLFSIAELLERFSMDRARNSLQELMDLSPETATVRRGGEEHVVPAEAVDVGETVVVRPGERVPLDGVVVDGSSAVDESPITGESVPVEKAADDEVYAGSIVAEGYLEVSVTAPASESTLARVIDLVEEAQGNRTESERFVDRFASYYTPVIVVGALLTTFVPPLAFGAPFETWFVRGLTLLVVACPCAFVISTPVSVVSGVTSAARNGVLVKGGVYLEALGAVDIVAFDKTGTLTAGELGVTDVVPLNDRSESDLLTCAASIESRSEHPIAAAIESYAREQSVGFRTVSDFEAIPGKGVRADLDGRTHYAGKPGLFEDLGFDLEHAHVRSDGGVPSVTGTGEGSFDPTPCEHGSYVDLVHEVVPRLQAEGKSVVIVGTEDELEGVIAIADTVRPSAKWAVSRLQELGLRTVMLTGDNHRTARVIADRVGIDAVRADLLPEQKVDAVAELERDGSRVAMVGDGVNDAPALATASVGIAMGAAGTDTALETADVALMSDDLTRLPYLFELSRQATRVIRQNIWSSLAVKGVLALAAPLGLITVIHAVVIGDMGMSLTVTGNAMRLARVAPDVDPDALAAGDADAVAAEAEMNAAAIDGGDVDA